MTEALKTEPELLEENVRERISAEEKEEVHPIILDWDQILQESLIVWISISKWHAAYSLNSQQAREAMGLSMGDPDLEDAMREVASLGQIFLIPKSNVREMKNLDNKLRYTLEDFSHPITEQMGLRGRLVPDALYGECRKTLREIETEFNQRAQGIADHLQALVSQQLDQARPIFAHSYDVLRSRGIELPQTRAAFIQEQESFFLSHVPATDDVRSRYQVDTFVATAAMPEEIARSEAAAQQIRHRMELSKENLSLIRKQALETAERDAKQQAAARQREVVQGFLRIETDFYEKVMAMGREVREAIDQGGKMTGPQGRKLRNLVERVRRLNVFGNEDLAADVQKIAEKLDARVRASGPDHRTHALEELQQALRDMEANTQHTLRTLPVRRGVRMMATGNGDDEAPSLTPVRRAGPQLTPDDEEDDLPRPVRRRRIDEILEMMR